ncbi:MAG TPA: bifunctional 3-demethylubiquinol 3-O-methyltransferase/2-polyprenyl-6-hydroxyphenol methylase [Rhodospirillaceae bacterium]|jgi:2-polyprenyl-6-hydroxyphenyl methylase/3-demethylubiquinone-9 3-methyltransferase|nr:bifunctional 2-polyprenyl-6-hydroxyphenol methylase/3-demethylubiquinol 3-O-methyltransferase UbiG [Alphaproteobacteria bacterium]HBH26174.1 bifunctional 3-demethylubiquinol 3-O-methyltransferase/2-polyprenyl-6-hydroxyphenol methylase [Rhodospirillaceae bacterium]
MRADAAEVGKFEAQAARWWDRRGPFAPLHAMNPARVALIRRWLGPLDALSVLDVGCGGGLAAEALARQGARVTGVDASPGAIEAARAHAAEAGLDIAYRKGGVEDEEGLYDVVLALEILEHVPDPADLIASCAVRLRPGGALIVSTVNRTAKSYALAICAAEYLLRWLPPGTHDWRRFLKPHEVAAMGRAAGFLTRAVCGLVPNPLTGVFEPREGRTGVNYMAWLKKPA